MEVCSSDMMYHIRNKHEFQGLSEKCVWKTLFLMPWLPQTVKAGQICVAGPDSRPPTHTKLNSTNGENTKATITVTPRPRSPCERANVLAARCYFGGWAEVFWNISLTRQERWDSVYFKTGDEDNRCPCEKQKTRRLSPCRSAQSFGWADTQRDNYPNSRKVWNIMPRKRHTKRGRFGCKPAPTIKGTEHIVPVVQKEKSNIAQYPLVYALTELTLSASTKR